MPRFARMLSNGMAERGHMVQIWSPKPRFVLLPFHKKIKKWMGYIDQYISFPIEVKRRLKSYSKNTIFVFTDHALGPWVPLVSAFPHVIHCHDFLAQSSAVGEIPENMPGWTGKRYQAYIKNGYSKGKNFISVSKKTREDLHKFLNFIPTISEVVYNGIEKVFTHEHLKDSKAQLANELNINLIDGYILHVGGNTWYKNRKGVLEIYNAWRKLSKLKLPLLMIGEKPSAQLLEAYSKSIYKSNIYFLNGLKDNFLHLAYSEASVFLFPSLAEGFGWPVAEAMASGCMVITTNQPPMTEVAGDAGFLISRRPNNEEAAMKWAHDSAEVVEYILCLSSDEREAARHRGILNAKRFDADYALDKIEKIYINILQSHK
ncbi:MAG: glycosyltransferase [Ginsengibacter sp.]